MHKNTETTLVHKRGMNTCGNYDYDNPNEDITFQWKRVNCPDCIEKGKQNIPKALLDETPRLKIKKKM